MVLNLLILAAAAALLAALPLEPAPEPPTLDLWPGQTPGETGAIGPEQDVTQPGDRLVGGRRVIRLGNVSRPTITLYRPKKAADTGAAVLIAPGGGYQILAWDLEGTEVAEWLASVGVTGILLKYRVPRRPDDPADEPPVRPLQDAQRAMSLARSRAREWGIDPHRIGMLGFSAGGNLTVRTATLMDRAYRQVDEVDRASFRPDFMILVYPAFLAWEDGLVFWLRVTHETPPAFFVHTGDDPAAGPESSVRTYLAFKKAGVPAELHLYPSGGHGYGLRPTHEPVTTWPARCLDWLRSQGILRGKGSSSRLHLEGPGGKQQSVPSHEVTLQGLVASLQEVLTPVGVQASTDHLFKGAVFGRDSLRVAEDLLAWFPSISRQVIVTLAHHQGREVDRLREEEPGRIHHEYRADFLGYEKVGREQLEIMEHLGAQWGWLTPGHELCYYGTVDATPQFARLICSFAARYGRDLLEQELRHRSGQSVTVRESLLLALAWIVRRLKESPLGLLEFQRDNPRGIRFQVMRDGALSYAHADGTLANVDAPIASLEVQGLAYDALTQSAGLLGSEHPREAEEWLQLAGRVQATVLERFWMADERYFAMALDRAPDGTVRPLRTLSTVPDELLETGLFDSLPEAERRRCVEAIVRRVYSEEFLTDAGIRSLARRHADRFGRDLWEYQGARVVWAVMTNVFARGLRRQGLLALARDIENRMLNAAALSGLYAEFFYVDLEGRVVYDPKGLYGRVEPGTILGTNLPERTQAWTVSALLRAFMAQEEEPIPSPTPLEEELLGRGPTERLRGSALAAAFPTAYAYQVDTKRAQAIEGEILEQSTGSSTAGSQG